MVKELWETIVELEKREEKILLNFCDIIQKAGGELLSLSFSVFFSCFKSTSVVTSGLNSRQEISSHTLI